MWNALAAVSVFTARDIGFIIVGLMMYFYGKYPALRHVV